MHQIADSHNDLLMAVRHLRERGHEDPFGDFWLPQLLEGGVRLQVLPVYTDEQFVGEGALRRALLLLEEAHILADMHSDRVTIVRDHRELQETLASDRIALLLAIEGAEPIGSSIELLDSLWRVGVRMCSLAWNRRTMMADGVGERDTGGKLTQLGVRAVKRMEELGIVVDVSHLSEAGFWHLADVAERPFIASHSSCRGLVDHPRNLSDSQLELMKERACHVGINSFGPFISEGQHPGISDYLDHAEHAMEIIGAERVGLGADFIVDVTRIVDPIFTNLLVPFEDIPETEKLERPEDYRLLAMAADKRLGEDAAERFLFHNLVGFLDRLLD